MNKIKLKSPGFILKELVNCFSDVSFWKTVARSNLRQKYQRSVIGSLWRTLSIGIQALVTGVIVTFIFKGSDENFLPYVIIGIIFWNFLTSTIIECCNSFQTYRAYLFQFRKPFFTYIIASVYQNIIVLFKNFIIIIGVLVIFQIPLNLMSFAFLVLNLLLSFFTLLWMGFLLAIFCSRFRDLSQMISTLFIILYWLTPILYYPNQLGEIEFIIQFNPLTHIMELLRSPLLGKNINTTSYMFLCTFNLLGFFVVIFLYRRLRSSIIFWV